MSGTKDDMVSLIKNRKRRVVDSLGFYSLSLDGGCSKTPTPDSNEGTTSPKYDACQVSLLYPPSKLKTLEKTGSPHSSEDLGRV